MFCAYGEGYYKLMNRTSVCHEEAGIGAARDRATGRERATARVAPTIHDGFCSRPVKG